MHTYFCTIAEKERKLTHTLNKHTRSFYLQKVIIRADRTQDHGTKNRRLDQGAQSTMSKTLTKDTTTTKQRIII